MIDSKEPKKPSNRMGRQRGWGTKFRQTLRGIIVAFLDLGNEGLSPAKSWTLNSFVIHIPAAIGVLLLGWHLQLDIVRMMVLTGCIAMVFIAEVFNTSIEFLARAVTEKEDENLRNSLDVAGGGVLIASLFAVAIGAMVFLV